MTGDRERMAPQMTPLVDPVDPGEKTQPAEGGRAEVEEPPDLGPGRVPAPDTRVQTPAGVDAVDDPTAERENPGEL